MIIVTGQVRFGEGEIERLRGTLQRTIEATRNEDGCEHYSYAVDLADPSLLHISEQWRDEIAIDAHMGSPHIAELGGALATAKVEALSVKAYEARYIKTLLGG